MQTHATIIDRMTEFCYNYYNLPLLRYLRITAATAERGHRGGGSGHGRLPLLSVEVAVVNVHWLRCVDAVRRDADAVRIGTGAVEALNTARFAEEMVGAARVERVRGEVVAAL